MARIKQASRKKSTKRPQLAVMPHKRTKNVKDASVGKKSSLEKVKETSSTAISHPSSSFSSQSHRWYYISSSDPLKETMSVAEGLPENAGKWLLFSNTQPCDLGGSSHHEYAWSVAKALVKDFKNTGIISAMSSHVEDEDSEPNALGTVCCYTSNYKDKLGVKRAADAIFKVFPYPLSMYYKTQKDVFGDTQDKRKKKVVAIYKYTIEKKFYERCASDSYNWQLVEFKNEASSEVKETGQLTVSYREIMPCIIASHQWLYVSSLEQNCERFVACSSNNVENLPDTAGKWLLFNSFSDVCPFAGVTHHDFAWKSLKHLVNDYKNSRIIAVKCSTNRIDATHPEKSVTCCYTANVYDSLSIEIAAKAIRKAYHYPDVMYYKTEKDSEAMICSQHGDRHIAIFRHMPDGKLYERCEDKLSWKFIPSLI